MIDDCKKGSMVTYITPYKNQVSLWEMATSFGMQLEDVEGLVSSLITEGDIKARIDSYNKIIHLTDDNYRVKSFEKALQAGDEFLRNIELIMNKYSIESRESKK